MNEENTSALTKEEEALLKKIEEKTRNEDPILSSFKQLEGKPTDEMIEEWKQQVGEVFLISLSDNETFVFRPLRRLEWRTMLKGIQGLDEQKQSEAIVIKACLWPELNSQSINMLTAGSVEAVKEMILQVSNFISPDVAMQLVRKL